MPLLRRLNRLLSKIADIGLDLYATKSYSQEGEDVVLNRIFADQDVGFYVDVGAHHPKRFSNTHLFYKRGWTGINIEPNPEAVSEFKSARPRDINLQLGVSDRAGALTYYWFDDPALNTFDPDLAQRRTQTTSYRVLRTGQVQVERLADILSKHVPAGIDIDFLTVDVEGHDLAVLQSNDWERFRPKYVLAEAIGKSLEEAHNSDIAVFMKGKRYSLFAKTYNTLFFRRES